MGWTDEEARRWAELDSPAKLQAFLDETAYSDEPVYRSPRQVLRDRKAHCVDGALFAACGLRRLGHPPLVVAFEAHRDDDHFVAVYRGPDRCWGAVSKSNTVGLRYREPVYRTIRELAMSYFEFYYNLEGEKSLRTFSRPMNLARYDRDGWETDDRRIEDGLVADSYHLRYTRLLTDAQIAGLAPVDQRTFDACLQGANWDGLWKNA